MPARQAARTSSAEAARSTSRTSYQLGLWVEDWVSVIGCAPGSGSVGAAPSDETGSKSSTSHSPSTLTRLTSMRNGMGSWSTVSPLTS